MQRCANFIFDNGPIANHKKKEEIKKTRARSLFLRQVSIFELQLMQNKTKKSSEDDILRLLKFILFFEYNDNTPVIRGNF